MSAYMNRNSRKTQQEREAEMVQGILGPMFPRLFASVPKPDDTLPWDGMEDDDSDDLVPWNWNERDDIAGEDLPLGPIPRDPLGPNSEEA